MAEIKFVIPNDKLPELVDALCFFRGEIPKDEEGEPLYTRQAWAKMEMRSYMIKQAARYKQNMARKAVIYEEDETLIGDVSVS